ncbi:MAG: TGS domain-containing protein [Candidatus Diapherotrites archaeon]|nr:TGS domain-containing protein [Candidatus Diapherotrites archaeon]
MNAPPEFNKAMDKYSSARSTQEKIRYLEEALRYLPKHKGTENMRKQLMRRLSELRKQLLKEKKQKKGGGKSFLVPKSGYQAVLWGFANAGKSYILNSLTSLNIPSTPRPVETDKPTPGMMDVGGGYVQLVELPSYFEGFRGSKFESMVFPSIRAADHLILVIDLSFDPEYQVGTLLDLLREHDIFPNREPPPVKVEKQHSGGIRFVGEDLLEGDQEEFMEVLQMFGLHNAVVVPYGRITPGDLFLALDESAKFIPMLLLGNKGGFEDEFLSLPHPKLIFRGEGSREELFRAMRLIRVYTKPPRGEISKTAVILPEGSTPEDLAEELFGRREIKQVRLWRDGRFRNVPKDYVLQDGDVIELR